MFTLLLIWCSDIYSVTINTCADPGSVSNFDNVFFVDEGGGGGGGGSKYNYKRAIIGPPAKRHFRRFAGVPMMVQH